MGNLKSTIDDIKKSIPPIPSTDPASLAKLVAGASALLGLQGNLTEQAENYVKAQIPDDLTIPTPTPGSFLPDTSSIRSAGFKAESLLLAADIAQAAEVAILLAQTVNDTIQLINGAMAASASAANMAKDLTGQLHSRKMKLYGTKALKAIEDSLTKTAKLATKKIALVKNA